MGFSSQPYSAAKHGEVSRQQLQQPSTPELTSGGKREGGRKKGGHAAFTEVTTLIAFLLPFIFSIFAWASVTLSPIA